MRRLAWFTAAVAIFALNSSLAHAAAPVEAATSGGRVLRGVVDARTDDARLWVRQEEGGVVLASSAAWGDVVQATYDGEAIGVDELRKRAGDAASAAPPMYTDKKVTPGTVLGTSPLVPARRIHVRNVQVVQACVVNLDRDVEVDGIRVSIAAMGADGSAVPVRGNLRARLFGEHRPSNVPTATYGELDHWSQPVAAADFVDGVATYELRFRRTAPEWQFDLLPDAVIDVQLGAYGEGDFAASSPVYLRPFNPLRDSQQLWAGTRFMQGEPHHPYPASMPMQRDGRWIHWTW